MNETKSEIVEKSTAIPRGIKIESVTKTERVLHPAPSQSRSQVFQTEKQRNTAYIQRGITKPGRISYDVLRRSAMSVHAVRICVNVLKEKVTKTKWVIQNVDQAKRQKDDPRIKELTEFFRHPNKTDSFRTLLDKMLEDLLILDTVCLEKTRYPDGTLAELHFVDAATVRPIFDEHGNQDVLIPLHTVNGVAELPVSYVQVMDNSQYGGPESGEIVAAWPSDDFIDFHMHPQGSIIGIGYGLSPIESVLSVVSNILNADNYNGTYFEEGSFPPIILQLIGQVNQRDIESYREYLYQELDGRFHRPAIMAGQTKAEVINLKDLNNRDMEFMDYMNFLCRLLAAAYGLSSQDIGLTEDTGSKNVAENQSDLSHQKGYSSILHLLKETFCMDVIWKDFKFDDLEFEWVADDNIDPKTASEIADQRLKNGTMTLNEARQKFGDLPFEDFGNAPMILTTEGYKPLIAQDVDVETGKLIEGTETGTEEDGKEVTTSEEGLEDEERPGEDGQKPDKERAVEADNRDDIMVEGEDNDDEEGEEDPNSEKKKKSMLEKAFESIRKAFSGVEPRTIEQEFYINPVMFGTLYQGARPDIARLFLDKFSPKNMKKIQMKGFKMLSYSYHYNTAKKTMHEYVTKYPKSACGMTYTEDGRGVKYTVYVKKII
jgi:phage portal protein BeeE